MKLESFSKHADLENCSELERCRHLAFFFAHKTPERECDLQVILDAFHALHFSMPNVSRLRKKILASNQFIRASSANKVRLHARALNELQERYPELDSESEEVQAADTLDILIPANLLDSPPTYLVRLIQQINASYQHNIFDGCAVLMRRMLEILLIQSYIKLEIDSEIRGANGSYLFLEGISNNAKNNLTLDLSRSSKSNLDAFRTLGNFAAHRIEFSTRKFDIEKIAQEYRATIEELAYKSGHKT